MSDRRAYRYKVTETGGEGTKAVGDSPFILDWEDFGQEHTWNIFKFGDTIESTGFITGTFVDKGYVGNDGQYKSDEEIESAT